MKVGILKDGDKVISVTNFNIAVQRVNGEVDIIPLTFDEENIPFVDIEHIVTITYGNNTVEMAIPGNDNEDGITIKTY